MTAIDDLRFIIEAAIVNAPRTLQAWAGPSELAISCDRCLVHKLAGTPQIEDTNAAWMPFIGTAVHAELACILARHETMRADLDMPQRYLTEHRVTVGTVGGVQRTGSVDAFDIETGTVIDFKVVGTTTMRKVRSGTVSKAYLGQVQLYGRGLAAAGYDVRSCAIWFLPRNGFHLGEAHVVQHDYSADYAEVVLKRADEIAQRIARDDLEAVLADCAPHTGEEFSCSTFPDYRPALSTTAGLLGVTS